MKRVIGTVLSIFCLMSLVLGLVSAQTGSSDIVLYAADAAVRTGNWQVVSDATAAGGTCIYNLDADVPKLPEAYADPTDYFEMTFSAEAGVPYRLWLRGKAQDDFWGNDSVFVQFSDSLDSDGAPAFLIGTTSATVVNLEDCSGCGLAGWGWQDNGWGAGELGPLVYFQSTGTHTIRIQPREDGLAIDQIVLSPATYLDASPGALAYDDVILPRSSEPPPPGNQPPQVSITASPTSGPDPLYVSFTSEAWDPDGYVASYNWTFGDGSTSTESSPSYTYTAAGSYTARLTVSDDQGATTSTAVFITVANQPPPTEGTPLKVLSWNVQFNQGTDEVYDVGRQATYVANVNPDLAGLCEIEIDQAAALVDALRRETPGITWYWHFVRKYPECDEGNLILSKYPLLSTSGHHLSYDRSVAQVEVSVGGRTINFFATHLDAYDPSTRQAQVYEMKSWMAGFAESRIVVGDFNAGPDLTESIIMRNEYYHSWLVAMDAGTAVSYPDNPVQLHVRTRRGNIDHIYYSHWASDLVLTGAEIPDTRDLSRWYDVRQFLGNLDDLGVRPSDHNQVIATFVVR